jgi:hypothetical protein
MKSLNTGLKVVLLAVLVVMTGCASSGSGSGGLMETDSQNVSNDRDLSLEDHLRRINNVRVSGSGNGITVTIRGNYSLSGERRSPLFVVNGQEVGRDFSSAARIAHKGTITSVRVLSPGKSVLYGSQGGAGVIEIEINQ